MFTSARSFPSNLSFKGLNFLWYERPLSLSVFQSLSVLKQSLSKELNFTLLTKNQFFTLKQHSFPNRWRKGGLTAK